MLSKYWLAALITSSAAVPLTVVMSNENVLAHKSSFRVYNQTSYDIERLYSSESSYSNWGNNLGVLAKGFSTQIIFGNTSNASCLYDFKAVYSNGAEIDYPRVDVCKNNALVFYNQRWETR